MVRLPNLEKEYSDEVRAGTVKVISIPDIESVNYGRGVGYEINEFVPPKDIGEISATEIRKNLKKEQIADKNYFQNNSFLNSQLDQISAKTSFNFNNKVENIKSFPVFTSDKFTKPEKRNIFFAGDALYAFPPSFAQGASQSIEASKEVYEEIENNTHSYYKKRQKKIKSVIFRSVINHFAFHISNPFLILIRNIVLKSLTKNNRFLENYLGKIYKN